VFVRKYRYGGFEWRLVGGFLLCILRVKQGRLDALAIAYKLQVEVW
jgi:hypothetical protein